MFGCHVYVMCNTQERMKLDPKSRKCIFFGYADNVKGYCLWDPISHKVIVSRNVVFAENELQSEQTNDSLKNEKLTVEIKKKSLKKSPDPKHEDTSQMRILMKNSAINKRKS